MAGKFVQVGQANGGRHAEERMAVLGVAAAALACVGLAFLVYWPSVDSFFVWDDYFFLRAVRNHSFLDVMYRAVTFPRAEPFDEVTLFWRPTIDLYFYAARPFGIHAQPFHMVNIALHGTVGALGVVFIWRLTRSGAGAVTTGLLFTVAPTYDFAVSWIAQVSEILGAMLILGALISFHAYLTSPVRTRLYLGATAVLMLLALLTKESTVILVLLLPALAFAVPDSARKRSWREIARGLAVPIALGLAFAVAMQAREFLEPGGFHTFGLNMARNLWRYLKWLVFPYQPGAYAAAREAGAAVFLAAGVAVCLLRQRVPGFLFVWTLLALWPFTGFGDSIELRYTYLATLPFIAFIACAAVSLVKRMPRPASMPVGTLLAVVVVGMLVVMPFRTRDQQRDFLAEGARYERMIDSVRNLCGPMPPESQIYVRGAPYLDLWGIHTPAAVNLYYDRVSAHAADEYPPLIAFVEDKCAIEYDAASGTYRRVTEF